MFRSAIVALVVVCCALPARAAPEKSDKKKSDASSSTLVPPVAPAPAPTKTAPAAQAPAPSKTAPAAPSGTSSKHDDLLPLEPPTAQKPKGDGKKAPADALQLDLMDIPTFDTLNVDLLKNVSLCIFPFIKEDKLSEGGSKTPQNLEQMQKVFFDVAKSSPVLKDAILLGKDSPLCGIEDVGCISGLGNFSGCQAVLAGRATREDNGFTLRARMVDAKQKKLLARVNQVLATDDNAQVAAWVEGQACKALKVDCKAKVALDADRPDMKVLIDNKPVERKPTKTGAVETVSLDPGVYRVRVTIGQRSSREETFAVRRGAAETIYARQTADGGIPLLLASSLTPGNKPGPSAEFTGGTRWTKPVGYVAAGLGALAVGFGAQQYLRSKSLVSDANAAYDRNGGFYKQSDLDGISSANNAKKTSTIATIAGAGLIVAGAVLVFAF